MKFILLAAAAVIAMPTAMSHAQTTPMGSAPAADQMAPAPTPMPPAPMQPAPAAPDPAMTATQTAPMPAQTMGGDPVGGYQPAGPAMSGPMTPGATVVFTPAPSPDQAYPAPAPLAKYPVCKKGQYDKCIQRGGR